MVTITLDSDFYVSAVIDEMICQFADFMTVSYSENDAFRLTMQVKEQYQVEKETLIHSFLNNILELSIQDIFNHGR